MRKLKGDKPWYQQKVKNLPLETCDLCAGVGRYKTTFKGKKEIIAVCWQCSGSGVRKIRVKYNGAFKQELFTGGVYDLISETEESFVIINRDKELMQVLKDDFEKVV